MPKRDRGLLDRILGTPHLSRIVPHLQPEVLHRVIQTCGLEDCADLIAMATPRQLQRIFDVDLWRSSRPGRDEALDAERFGLWLEVLMESGAAVAVEKLVGMDVELVITALAQHFLVFDGAAQSSYTTTDGDQIGPSHQSSGEFDCKIGGYIIEARLTASWDAIVALLLHLDAEQPAYFHRVMEGCRRLSNSRPEVDGLDGLLPDDEQDMFDLAVDRETRREQSGYLSPAQASAFLQGARRLQLSGDAVPPASPIANAYFRSIESAPEPDSAAPRDDRASAPPREDEDVQAMAEVMDLLARDGVLAPQPRALLEGRSGASSRLARIEAHLEIVRDSDPVAYAQRTQELAYLANALVAGCSLQSRVFTAPEASDAAVAVCNLGLENWPTQWLPNAAREDFLVRQDLIAIFQVGWTILHRDVAMYAAEQLIRVLSDLRCRDRDIQMELKALRLALSQQWRKGTPWHARDALDVIMMLDSPAWATLLGLLSECPVVHAALGAARSGQTRAVSASDFEFIAGNSQIAAVREFMQSLPETLRG